MSQFSTLLALVFLLGFSNSACNYVKSLGYVSWPDGNITINPGDAHNFAVMPTGVCLSNDAWGYNEIPFFDTDGSVKIVCNNYDETMTINKYKSNECSGDSMWHTMYASNAKGASFDWECGGSNCVVDITITDYNKSDCAGTVQESKNAILVQDYCYGEKQYICIENGVNITNFVNGTIENNCQGQSYPSQTIDGCGESSFRRFTINRCINMEETTASPTGTPIKMMPTTMMPTTMVPTKTESPSVDTEKSEVNIITTTFVYIITIAWIMLL